MCNGESNDFVVSLFRKPPCANQQYQASQNLKTSKDTAQDGKIERDTDILWYTPISAEYPEYQLPQLALREAQIAKTGRKISENESIAIVQELHGLGNSLVILIEK